MRRVLVLAYYFPPLGGAGVQRTVKLLKHLPRLGYEPVVVTAPAAQPVAWAPEDTAQLAELPSGLEVHRVAPPPRPAGRLRSRQARLLGRIDPHWRWWVDAASEVAAPLVAGNDVVYASMSPFETSTVAARITSGTSVPWVADLRDPWALDEWAVYPSALHRKIEERRMGALLSTASAVIMNTPEAARVAAARFGGLAPRLAVVPNGWDRDDFDVEPEPRDGGRFRIVYAGYSHVFDGVRHRRVRRAREMLGGSVRGLDVLTRSHVFLIEALRRIVESDPEFGRRVELHLAGASPPSGLADPFVVDRGYLPHRETIALLLSADLLFLPMQGLPAGTRTRTVPGKTYEYLASGRPILGALPAGDARDLLEELPQVRLCEPADVDCLAAAVRAFAAEAPTATDVPAVAAGYEREVLASRIAAIFDALIALERRAA